MFAQNRQPRAPYPVLRARTGTTTKHIPPCDDILILKEKVAALSCFSATNRGGIEPPSIASTPRGVEEGTEADLKEIRDVISQVKLLITLSLYDIIIKMDHHIDVFYIKSPSSR